MRTKLTKIALPAALVLAMALTLSCSGDEPVESGSSNKIRGFAQKGPFADGAVVTLHELDSSFNRTGRSFKSEISGLGGKFEMRRDSLASNFALFEVNGRYFSEATSFPSTASVVLFAIADVSEKDSANINVLTHLEHGRVLSLVGQGLSFADAKKQAQKEILAVFGISGEFENSDDMSIFGATESNAALLAVSVMMEGGLPEDGLSLRMAYLNRAIWDGSMQDGLDSLKGIIADWAFKANLTNTRGTVYNWNRSSEIPAFEKHVTNYWMADYGLAACDSLNEGKLEKIAKDTEDVSYICKSGSWVEPSVFEKNTYGWECSDINDMETKTGQSTGTKYVCLDGTWQTGPNQYGYDYKKRYCSKNECRYFTDSRDGKQYAYVTIGEQTWMAQNLNYDMEGSKCPDNETAYCRVHGRLYRWTSALTACPEGWHLPSKEEWEKLAAFVEGDGSKLKTTVGWEDDYWGVSGNGTDEYGFSAASSASGGQLSQMWASTERDASKAWSMSLIYTSSNTRILAEDKQNGRSVRCLMD